MKKSSYQSEIILNMNERLFLNALSGITDENAKERISDHNNPLIWILTHTVWARYNMCQFLGKPGNNPYSGMFENFKPFEVSMKFPAIDNLKAEWKKASDLLKEGLASVTEEHLASDSPLKSPIGDFTIGGTIAFLAQHESYDIGQIAFLKKFLTKEAMSYN
ncbi:MAG: DinB family protein [Bacteroidia bacterium]